MFNQYYIYINVILIAFIDKLERQTSVDQYRGYPPPGVIIM